MSHYLRNKLIDHLFRDVDFPPPEDLFVALCTEAPTASDTGNTISEVIGTGYARVSYPPSYTANWEATQGGTSGASTGSFGGTANSTSVTFPEAISDWGAVTGVAILDAAEGGNLLFYGELEEPQEVASGDTFVFASGSLAVELE